jgi:hypothetical protein
MEENMTAKSKAGLYLYAVLLPVSLAACGGGGGTATPVPPPTQVTPPVVVPPPVVPPVVVPPAEPADGLGIAGHFPGTLDLGAATLLPLNKAGLPISYAHMAVTLSDDGKALLALQYSNSYDVQNNLTYWAQSSPQGQWGSFQPVAAAGLTGRTGSIELQMNAAGNAILNWTDLNPLYAINPKAFIVNVARYIEGKGWDPAVYEPSAGDIGNYSDVGAGTDISLLADSSFTYSGVARDYEVVRTTLDGRQQRLLPVNRSYLASEMPLFSREYTFFAPHADGYGLYYTTSISQSEKSMTDVNVRWADVNNVAFAPWTIASYSGFCDTRPIVATTTDYAEGVLSVVSRDSADCTTENLDLIRVNRRFGVNAKATRVSEKNVSILFPPKIFNDAQGNALAVWVERTKQESGTPVTPVRTMWSRSMYGENWSIPQILMSNSPASSFDYLADQNIAVAMNAAGQAVAAKLVQNDDYSTSIMVNKFAMGTGWGDWTKVAHKAEGLNPHVAINASGQAVVAYLAYPSTRTPFGRAVMAELIHPRWRWHAFVLRL